MGTPEIFLEHRKGEKVHKHLRVQPDKDMFMIGSSREADLRINGEGVMGCHAVLRYRAPDWYVCDISGTESLKVDGQTVSEAKVDATAKIEIAGHRIQLFLKERKNELFKDEETSNGMSLHQVVVRSRGRVLETHLLRPNESFKFVDGYKTVALPAPRDSQWVKTEVGARLIQQRLVGAQEIAAADKVQLDGEMKKSLAASFVFLMLLIGLVVLMTPKGADVKPEVALDKKSMDVIFNAKAVKMKRQESQKVVKSAAGRAGGHGETASQAKSSSAPEESMAPNPGKGKATAALTSIRQSGLSALVGKIAKRANRQGILVAASGVSPDVAGSGRAFFSTGTSTVGGGGVASKEGPTYRLGGVGTQGKAGGTGGFRNGTALAGAGVGTGNIVALVDEETVIEGGLDRDAIAEVIKRNIGQIRYCYERQLSSNPDLYGKVMVKFTIGAAGDVSNPRVDNSTLKSAMVEGCILRRLASWKFPLPKGGTNVNVAYPFLFKALD